MAQMLILCLTLIATLSACSTRKSSTRHPVQDGRLFQPPIVDLSEYEAVHTRFEDDNVLALAVAISGGGQRAGNLGVGALLGLEELPRPHSARNVLEEVDYFSTVSGGGMAVGAYISALYSHGLIGREVSNAFSFAQAVQRRNEDLVNKCKSKNVRAFYQSATELDPSLSTDPCLRRHLERGYHGNIASAFLRPKIIFTNLDRGDLLEEAFAEELMGGNWLEFHNQSQLTLRQIFPEPGRSTGIHLPMWITNATVLENGAILPFTPDVLAAYKVNEYVHRMSYVKRGESTNSSNFYYDVPLSLGLTASGNFPSLIAPQTLGSSYDTENNPYLHVIDGGVSDNLGIHTAISLLEHEVNDGRKKVLIVIDAYPGEYAPYSSGKGGPNFIKVYLKLPNMPLDGARGRARQTLKSFSSKQDSHVVYLSFDDLYRPYEHDIHKEDPAKVAALFDELERFYSRASILENSQVVVREENPDLESPFELARKVKTSYNITKAEQDFLIAVGRYIVDANKDEILESLR